MMKSCKVSFQKDYVGFCSRFILYDGFVFVLINPCAITAIQTCTKVGVDEFASMHVQFFCQAKDIFIVYVNNNDLQTEVYLLGLH